jgi:drug/metabolite transporter (DMT)-like permease
VSARTTVALFAGYTLLSVAGLVLLRANVSDGVATLRGTHGAGTGATPVGLSAVGVACYVSGFGLWLAILARVPLSRAYPTAVGLTLVFTTLLAGLFLHERIGPRELAGALVVFVGIWLLTAG